MAEIFISYKTVDPDQRIAAFLHQRLSELDHSVFMAKRSLLVGRAWDQDIQKNLAKAEWFVPLI